MTHNISFRNYWLQIIEQNVSLSVERQNSHKDFMVSTKKFKQKAETKTTNASIINNDIIVNVLDQFQSS